MLISLRSHRKKSSGRVSLTRLHKNEKPPSELGGDPLVSGRLLLGLQELQAPAFDDGDCCQHQSCEQDVRRDHFTMHYELKRNARAWYQCVHDNDRHRNPAKQKKEAGKPHGDRATRPVSVQDFQ